MSTSGEVITTPTHEDSNLVNRVENLETTANAQVIPPKTTQATPPVPPQAALPDPSTLVPVSVAYSLAESMSKELIGLTAKLDHFEAVSEVNAKTSGLELRNPACADHAKRLTFPYKHVKLAAMALTRASQHSQFTADLQIAFNEIFKGVRLMDLMFATYKVVDSNGGNWRLGSDYFSRLIGEAVAPSESFKAWDFAEVAPRVLDKARAALKDSAFSNSSRPEGPQQPYKRQFRSSYSRTPERSGKAIKGEKSDAQK